MFLLFQKNKKNTKEAYSIRDVWVEFSMNESRSMREEKKRKEAENKSEREREKREI